MTVQTQRRGVGRPRGDQSTERPIYTSEQSLVYWVRVRRAEFLAMPDRVQRDTLAHVSQLLERERRQRERQQRRDASPLARMAFRVYGIWVPWLSAAQQLDDTTDPALIESIDLLRAAQS